MPPRARVTREMIVDAAFEIARAHGAEGISARAVSEKLSCSTQPVMYHFKRIEDLKRAVYQRADECHTGYLMNFSTSEPMMDMGLNYIRFAAEEKELFRLLFQSNEFAGRDLSELMAAEELRPMLEMLGSAAEVDVEQAGAIFSTLFLFVHGYASMLANNAMEYDEERIAKQLEQVFVGAVYAAGEEKRHAEKAL